MTSRQLIIGHQRVEVMDMVVADVAGQLVEYPGQAVVGAALDGGAQVVPLVLPLLIGVFVLMLHVKEPNGNNTEEKQDGQVDDQQGFEAEQPDEGYKRSYQQQVVPQQSQAGVLPAAEIDEGQTALDKKVPGRPQNELHRRRAEEDIAELIEAAQAGKFLNGQQLNIADAAVFPQQTVVTVVEIMALRPIFIGQDAEHAADHADNVVGFAGGEKGLVSAIVLDNKDTDQEKRVDHGQQQHQPNADIHQEIHGYPNGQER